MLDPYFFFSLEKLHARTHTAARGASRARHFSMQRDVTVAKGRLFKAMSVTASLLRADTIECEYITEGLNILPGT